MSELLSSPTPEVDSVEQIETEVPKQSIAETNVPLVTEAQAPRASAKRIGIAILIPCALFGIWFLMGVNFPTTPLPICATCSSKSVLRETLETLGSLWEHVPASSDELANELTLVESANRTLQSSKYGFPISDNECITILLHQFDERLDQYTQSVIADLVGFGPDDACPKLRALLTVCERLQVLMINNSKETPKCKELLEWHSQQYSCSTGQR